MEKSIKELAWNVPEETYRADKAYSYSTLSRFEREGFRKLDHLFDRIETPSLTFGSAVDSLLTDGEDNFNSRFVVCEFPPLPDSLIGIARELHQKFNGTFGRIEDIPDSEIDMATLNNDYYTNPKYRNYRIKNVREKCGEYYSLLTLAGDRTILSQSDYDDVMACVNELRTSPVTREFFTVNPFQTDVEKVFQLKFKGEYKGIPIRCMADLIVVNHNIGTIQMVDLKTTKDVRTFRESFFKWRYFYQAQMYAEILRQNIEKDSYFRTFEILPYQFVAIDRVLKEPVVFTYRNTFSNVDTYTPDGWVRHWTKELDDLDWYLKHPDVKLSRHEYYELQTKGSITIRGFFPVVEEQWEDVKDFEEFYYISNLGRLLRKERRVWSERNSSFITLPEKIIIPECDKEGYLRVRLTKEGESQKFFVHRLVAQAFIPNPDNLPCVNHIDECSKNNRFDNLEWCSAEYNSNYGTRKIRISERLGRAVERYSLSGEYIDSFPSAAEACRKLELPANRQSNISAVCRGVRKSSLGYVWKFKE